jgi:quercetin dioxygenase-like cupin family protein
MTLLETERWSGYETAWPGHHRQPFNGVDQYPCVITRADAEFNAWAPEDSVTQPVWCYVSTHRVNCGTFYVQPKEWFDPGNHPGPEPYYALRGTLLLGNPDTADVIEINAGDAANIPAFAYHIAFNFSDTEAEILWWVPGEMHPEDFKKKIHDGQGKWYEREPVMLNGPRDRNEGFPSHLDDLAKWPPERPTKGPLDMQHLPRSTWLHTFEGVDRRKTILASFFYCDERIRCAKLSIPRWGESQKNSGDYERLLYVESGTLSVNLTASGRGLIARPGDMVFVPPFVEHSLQAIDDEPVSALCAWAYA